MFLNRSLGLVSTNWRSAPTLLSLIIKVKDRLLLSVFRLNSSKAMLAMPPQLPSTAMSFSAGSEKFAKYCEKKTKQLFAT